MVMEEPPYEILKMRMEMAEKDRDSLIPENSELQRIIYIFRDLGLKTLDGGEPFPRHELCELMDRVELILHGVKTKPYTSIGLYMLIGKIRFNVDRGTCIDKILHRLFKNSIIIGEPVRKG